MPPIKFNMPATIRLAVVCLLIGLILGLLTCNTCKRIPKCEDKVITKTVIKHDTIWYADTLHMLWQKPIPI
jgi:hypothetical protein